MGGEGEGWSSGESCSSQLCAPNPPGTFGRDELFCLCKYLPFLGWLAFCGTKPGLYLKLFHHSLYSHKHAKNVNGYL